MTKTELIKKIHDLCPDYKLITIKIIVEALITIVIAELIKNNKITISNAFVLYTKVILSHIYRDFQTGSLKKSQAHRVLKVKPSGYLARKLRENTE